MKMEAKIIYIAGPITDMLDQNRPLFEQATRIVRNLGYIVRNPHELCADIPADKPWEEFMRRCLPALCECTDLILLPEWKFSRGANIERSVAISLGIRVHDSIDEFMKAEHAEKEVSV